MNTADVQVGSTITNGSSALRVTERVEKDTLWGTPSWRGTNISLEKFGGNVGLASSVPDYLLGGWYHVSFEWVPVVGGGLEERYVWTADYRRLQREVRVDCRSEHGVGHQDCPKCWRWSERNPNAVPLP